MQWTTLFNRFATRHALALVAGSALLGSTPAAGKTISGVCPDGSIFIVQRLSAVPCSDAKQVDPSDIPPLNPELLPRPYGWEKFQDRQNPNNPYNVVDSAPSVHNLGGPEPEGPRDWVPRPEPRSRETAPQMSLAPDPTRSSPAEQLRWTARATAPSVYAREAPMDPALLFPEQDLRDLALIVELSQRRAPATFRPREGNAEGTRGLTLRIAYSASFEPRLRELFRGRGGLPPGNVLLFSVVASDSQPFFGNLTFVQAGAVYHPNRDDVRDLGVLRSEFGLLRDGDTLLGYARLPEDMDLASEIDIYWNDRLLSAILRPS